MSVQLSTAAISLFDTEVHHELQAMGDRLRDTVRIRTGLAANDYNFPKMGKGLAQRRTTQSDVVPMNIAHTRTKVTAEDWIAAEYTDVFDEAKTNISERTELAQTIAKAIKRRSDQQILDALSATASTKTVGTDIGGTGSNLNVAKILSMAAQIYDTGAEDGEVYFVGTYFQQQGLLSEDKATSTDYASAQALATGRIQGFAGITFRWVPSMAEGGLEKASNARTCFAYTKPSIGMIVTQDQRMEVNYIPQKTSWLAAMLWSAGAAEIDPAGVVEVTCTEPA